MTSMPDPERTARRSAAVCINNGIPYPEAFRLIAGIADAVMIDLLAQGSTDVQWLRDVSAAAVRIGRITYSSETQAGC